MNISIKNVNEEDWRVIKSEAAKNNLNIAKFLNRVIIDYKKKHTEENNWNDILYGKKFLSEKDAKKIKEVMKDVRKEFEFRAR
ncbi:MAG: hypothetical protein IH934_06975 [Nanoarchaeota archaeon]|nr:hypothetical protein [Nanoarchaeota archaeon]